MKKIYTFKIKIALTDSTLWFCSVSDVSDVLIMMIIFLNSAMQVRTLVLGIIISYQQTLSMETINEMKTVPSFTECGARQFVRDFVSFYKFHRVMMFTDCEPNGMNL